VSLGLARSVHLLVCFSGIDGSGKTTLCREVVTKLRARQVPCRYVYGRFLPVTIATWFKIASLQKQRTKQLSRNQYIKQIQNPLLRSRVVAILFIIGVLFDQALRILFKVYIPSILKKEVVICDRYLFDTVIMDIALNCAFDRNEVWRLLQRCLRMFPKVDIAFIVNVPPAIAYQRKAEYPIEMLTYLSDMYLFIGRRFGAKIMDGTKDLSELTWYVVSNVVRSNPSAK